MPGNATFSVNWSKVKPQQFVTSPSETVWWKKRTQYYGAAQVNRGCPDGPVGKESTCNAGNPGSIPGSGRSAGEGRGDPLQYSWVSCVAQLVRNLPAMRETWVRSLGWEDPLEKGKATHSSILT